MKFSSVKKEHIATMISGLTSGREGEQRQRRAQVSWVVTRAGVR